MDPFVFFENREIDLEDLFSVNKTKEDDITHLFRKLGHCMDKKVIFGGISPPWRNI